MEQQKVEYRYSKKYKDRFIKAYIGTRQVGYAWFTIDKNEAFLHYIEVKGIHRQLHIGSSLLDGVEAICREHRVDYIEGKFYPTVSKDVALAFYEKNGFFHFRDGYEQFIGKYIHITKSQSRKVRIVSFEDYQKEKESLEENNITICDMSQKSEEKSSSPKTKERLKS